MPGVIWWNQVQTTFSKVCVFSEICRKTNVFNEIFIKINPKNKEVTNKVKLCKIKWKRAKAKTMLKFHFGLFVCLNFLRWLGNMVTGGSPDGVLIPLGISKIELWELNQLDPYLRGLALKWPFGHLDHNSCDSRFCLPAKSSFRAPYKMTSWRSIFGSILDPQTTDSKVESGPKSSVGLSHSSGQQCYKRLIPKPFGPQTQSTRIGSPRIPIRGVILGTKITIFGRNRTSSKVGFHPKIGILDI